MVNKPETVAPATEKKETKPKFPKVLIIVLSVIGGLVVLGMILSFAGSIFVGNQILKNVGLNTTDDGKTVTIGSGDEKITVSDTQKWPDTTPSSVPEFSAGKITAAAQYGETWTITAEDVALADYNSYVTSLKSAGYKMDDSLAMTGLNSAAGTKDGYRVGVTYVQDEDGSNMMISVIKDTPVE